MKYCPQCQRNYSEPWLAFCSDDGTPLIEDLTPAKDPNWDPKIREPKVDTASEQETQWLPREPPMPGAWVAPDERPPMSPGPWQPPPPPMRPTQQPSQGLALASMIIGIIGVVTGWCFGPIPGLLALLLGWMALSQIKKSPETVSGRSYAVAGMILGAINVAFNLLFLLWFLLRLPFR